MVFYYDYPGYVVYMGADSNENDKLIEHGWATDIWFHVDSLSSAHVYLRLPLSTAMAVDCNHEIMDLVPDNVIEDMCQLVKNNSIEGCKKPWVSVVYTPHSNLRKEESMKEGSVSFHNKEHRKLRKTEKNKEIVKQLEKTKREGNPDLGQERLEHEAEIIQYKKEQTRKAHENAEKIAQEAGKETQRLRDSETQNNPVMLIM